MALSHIYFGSSDTAADMADEKAAAPAPTTTIPEPTSAETSPAPVSISSYAEATANPGQTTTVPDASVTDNAATPASTETAAEIIPETQAKTTTTTTEESTPSYADVTNPSVPTNATPPAPSSPKNAPTLTKLRLLALRTLTRLALRTDTTLTRLSTLLSTPRGIDVTLCTLSYTLQLLAALTRRYLDAKLASIAETLVEKAEPLLLPGESLTATFPAPKKFERLAKLMTGMKTLNGVIADYRIFVRLWGMLGLYTWARGTWNSPLGKDASTKEKIVRGVAWGEIASLVAFQILENGAYLSSKGVLTSDAWAGEAGKRRETKWWVWSCRFWCAYVVLEGVRLGTERYYREEKVQSGEKEEKIAKEAEKRLWWRDVISNTGYFPMTLHWSVEEGIFSDVAVGVFGMIAGGANLWDAWRGTR